MKQIQTPVLITWAVITNMLFATLNAQTNFHGLVVLIDFSDAPGTVTVSRADSMINTAGYTEPTVTASLRDYWYAQSRGNVEITHDVFGYYRAPQTAAWYDTMGTEFFTLITDALNWVVTNNPDYDWDALSLASGDMNRNGTEEGTFLSVNFMTNAWIPGTGGTHWLTGWTAPNGVATQQVCAFPFISPWNPNVNLFWITHEQGHTIWGWPDTYDYTNSSRGTGIYCLMSGNQETGDIEPVGGPFLAQEGWVDVIDNPNGNVILTADGNSVARFYNPADSLEYFVVEARKRSTIGNASFPVQKGLLIWHVDDNVTTSNTQPQGTPSQHYRIAVEQADGLFHLEGNVNPGDSADVYKPGHVFNDVIIPNANWWNGNASTINIGDIQFLSNDRISFYSIVDSDADGINYPNDNCLDVSNPLQEDMDHDGLGDLCDDAAGDRIGINTNLPDKALHIHDGTLYLDNAAKGIILKGMDGNCYRLVINLAGVLENHLINCPD